MKTNTEQGVWTSIKVLYAEKRANRTFYGLSIHETLWAIACTSMACRASHPLLKWSYLPINPKNVQGLNKLNTATA
eukprot:1156029-Pelagomonas_calceolata.AAC.6